MPNPLTLGTRWRTVDHSIPSVNYSSGNRVSVEIPKGFLYKGLLCRLRGNLVVTVAATAIDGESPLALIQRLEIIADGRKVLFAASGKMLYRLCHVLRQKAGERRPPGVGVATNPFSTSFIIDFQAIAMQLPPDSIFDPAPYEKIELAVTWGAVATLISAGTATIDAATTALDVHTMETSVGANLIGFTKIVSEAVVPVLATNAALREKIPRSGLLHGILLQTTRANPSEGSVDDIVNSVRLLSDNNWLHKDALRWKDVQSRNVIEHQMDGSAPYGPGAAGIPSQDGTITGYIWLPLVEDGMMTSAINTTELNQFEIEFNVTFGAGTQQIRIIYVFYEPRLPVAAAAA